MLRKIVGELEISEVANGGVLQKKKKNVLKKLGQAHNFINP